MSVPINLPAWLSWLGPLSHQGPAIIAAIVVFLGLLSALCTSLAVVFKLLVPVWPFADKIVDELGVAGLKINRIGQWFAMLGSKIGRKKPPSPPAITPAAQAGYARLGAVLASLVLCSGVLVILGLLGPLAPVASVAGCAAAVAVVPVAVTLAICIADTAQANPGLDFLQFLTAAVDRCGADAEAIIKEIIASTDPNVAQYAKEAKAAQGDPAKLAEAKAYVASHRRASR
jgi:hypothetical protein